MYKNVLRPLLHIQHRKFAEFVGGVVWKGKNLQTTPKIAMPWISGFAPPSLSQKLISVRTIIFFIAVRHHGGIAFYPTEEKSAKAGSPQAI
jgi:hypothetical protein